MKPVVAFVRLPWPWSAVETISRGALSLGLVISWEAAMMSPCNEPG